MLNLLCSKFCVDFWKMQGNRALILTHELDLMPNFKLNEGLVGEFKRRYKKPTT